MNVKLSIEVGATPFVVEFEVASQKQVFEKAGFFMELGNVKCCGMCSSPRIALEHRQVKGNDYYSIRCKECGGELNYGQHKTGNTLFQKNRGEWKKWDGYSQADQPNGDAPKKGGPVDTPDDSDVPF